MKKTKLCVITGSRAEYGLLKPFLKAVKADFSMKLQILVTGSHLDPHFGNTYREILKDGFSIAASVPILGGADSQTAILHAMGRCVSGVGRALSRLRPDLVVCMGDRYEILSSVSAALILKIPCAHFSGGEITKGAMDDAIRHAITKMSHLHFTSTEEHRRRVIQMGEPPSRVYNVGEIGLADIRTIDYLSRRELEKVLGLRFHKKNYLVTFHPVTLESDQGRGGLAAVLKAMDRQEDCLTIITKCGADPAGRRFNQILERYVRARRGRAVIFDSLGRRKYLSLMRQVDAVVGNSSSGIVEAPSLKVATVNVGRRQEGRPRAQSVIDCAPDAGSIDRAIRRAATRAFQDRVAKSRNPYACRGLRRTVSILRQFLKNPLIQKDFFDLKSAYAYRR